MEPTNEVNRDCNTCRHHKQARRGTAFPLTLREATRQVTCELCLVDLAINGELSAWQPEIDPSNNIEA